MICRDYVFNFISELFRYVYAYVCVRVPSHVRLFVTPWTVERQTPLSMEFSRQEYWSGLPLPFPGILESGLPFPSLRDLPDPGIKPISLALASRFFTTEPSGKPQDWVL